MEWHLYATLLLEHRISVLFSTTLIIGCCDTFTDYPNVFNLLYVTFRISCHHSIFLSTHYVKSLNSQTIIYVGAGRQWSLISCVLRSPPFPPFRASNVILLEFVPMINIGSGFLISLKFSLIKYLTSNLEKLSYNLSWDVLLKHQSLNSVHILIFTKIQRHPYTLCSAMTSS